MARLGDAGVKRHAYSLPGDALVSAEIDGPQRVYPHGARNRAERRHILFTYRPRNPDRAWREACERVFGGAATHGAHGTPTPRARMA